MAPVATTTHSMTQSTTQSMTHKTQKPLSRCGARPIIGRSPFPLPPSPTHQPARVEASCPARD